MPVQIRSKVVKGMYITYVKFPYEVISSVPVHKEFLEKFPRMRIAREYCAKYINRDLAPTWR